MKNINYISKEIKSYFIYFKKFNLGCNNLFYLFLLVISPLFFISCDENENSKINCPEDSIQVTIQFNYDEWPLTSVMTGTRESCVIQTEENEDWDIKSNDRKRFYRYAKGYEHEKEYGNWPNRPNYVIKEYSDKPMGLLDILADLMGTYDITALHKVSEEMGCSLAKNDFKLLRDSARNDEDISVVLKRSTSLAKCVNRVKDNPGKMNAALVRIIMKPSFNLTC